jgi:hypothetical protein
MIAATAKLSGWDCKIHPVPEFADFDYFFRVLFNIEE